MLSHEERISSEFPKLHILFQPEKLASLLHDAQGHGNYKIIKSTILKNSDKLISKLTVTVEYWNTAALL